MKRAASGIPAGDRGTADRIEADEGAYWIRLTSRQALDREGDCMGNCVGDGDYDRYAGGEELTDDAIWSLRTAGGVSMLTVEIRDQILVAARGRENHGPGRGASLQVRHLAAAFVAADRLFRVDEDTGIVLLDDGRSFRRDRLPPDVVAAREEAERAREAERAARRRRERERESGPGGGYEIGHAQVFVRPAGSTGPFRPIGPMAIRREERPDRPVILGPVIQEGPLHPAFELTASEADPVVETWHEFETGAEGFRTRSGIRFRMRTPLLAQYADPRQAFMEAYRAAIAQAEAARNAPPPARPPEPRLSSLLQMTIRPVEPGVIYDIGWNGRSARHVETVDVIADDRLPRDAYRLDRVMGVISFEAAYDVVTVRFRVRQPPEPARTLIQTRGLTAITAAFADMQTAHTVSAEPPS